MDDLELTLGIKDTLAKQIATPFGDTPWIQGGARINGPRSLKTLLTHRPADESVYDLTPETCVGLKGRMMKRGY